MNQKATSLNLTHTHFVTPHGLDDQNHYTSAYELAILTDYALKNEKFKEIVATKTTTISVNGTPRTIFNTNELLGNLAGVYGVKTGFTFNAGRCLVSSCKQNGMDIIVVVLGADTKNQRTRDSINIIHYIFDNFEYVDVADYVQKNFATYQNFYQQQVTLHKTLTVPEIELAELQTTSFPLKSNTAHLLSTKFYTLHRLSKEVAKDSKIGCMTLYYNDKILCSVDIFLKNEIQQKPWHYYFGRIFKDYKSYFYN